LRELAGIIIRSAEFNFDKDLKFIFSKNFIILWPLRTSDKLCLVYEVLEMAKEWWEGELANDILGVLRKKELTLAQYKASSPQLAVRRYLVDWLAIIFEKIGSSYGILHLSVTLMDYFMDNHDIPEPQLHLVALTCFLLAGIKQPPLILINIYF
jgi:hypothetical protein